MDSEIHAKGVELTVPDIKCQYVDMKLYEFLVIENGLEMVENDTNCINPQTPNM